MKDFLARGGGAESEKKDMMSGGCGVYEDTGMFGKGCISPCDLMLENTR